MGIGDDHAIPSHLKDVEVGFNRAQLRILTLNYKQHQDSTLFRLQKGWILQFRIGPSLFGKKIIIYTNHPENSKEGFERNRYRTLKWKKGSRNRADDTSMYAEIQLIQGGSFHYYYVTDENNGIIPDGSGFFIVDPELIYGNNEILPLDCIQCQTVLTKCLGTFDQWEDRLRVCKESGYNMIHFTPVQELGGSLSSYSLRDQLKLNAMFSADSKVYTLKDVKKLTDKMRKEWKVLSIQDIVLNHSANCSPWLDEHPECAYNLCNSPHLRPAYLLDRVLVKLSLEVSDGIWTDRGIPVEVNCEQHLDAIRAALFGTFLPQVNIHELFIVDVDKLCHVFRDAVSNRIPPLEAPQDIKPLQIIQDPQYQRYQSSVDMEQALLLYNKQIPELMVEADRIKKCTEAFKDRLETLNREKQKEIERHLEDGINNVLAGIRYERILPHGPLLKAVCRKHPLTCQYFTHYGPDTDLRTEEDLMYSNKACYLMAHNGWVMNADPLKDFAASGSNVYLRRELIGWGDSVKLRYGEKPEDCPYLWNHMLTYCQQVAEVFDGIRLDNCHSTPIHVAEYMIDAARRINPELYVIAELFTQNEHTDNIYVNRLGINSLIREAMSAWDSHEQGRLVYRYGGDPVGAFIQPARRPLTPSIAHAIFIDQTHDNPSSFEKRSPYDILPTTAMVSMACCASGSNRGYDEMVPHHIHVVNESRLYSSWSHDLKELSAGVVNRDSGIIAAKRSLNDLHNYLGRSNYRQVFVDQMNENVVAITRHCPITHKSVILVAHTSFQYPNNNLPPLRPMKVQGKIEEILLEAKTICKSGNGDWDFCCKEQFVPNPDYILGSQCYTAVMKENIQMNDSDMVELRPSQEKFTYEVHFKNFPPGSVIAFMVSLYDEADEAIMDLWNHLRELGYTLNAPTNPNDTQLFKILKQMSLSDFNHLLFRCDSEEKDATGGGVYMIDNIGPLPYAGLQGLISCLCHIRVKNDLGHPFCDNLRRGDWMLDYISGRLVKYSGTQAMGHWLQNVFSPLKNLPRYLLPCYFDAIISAVYVYSLVHVWKQMDSFIRDGSDFVKCLALGSVQCGGVIKSSKLPMLSPNLAEPKPPISTDNKGNTNQACITLAAGLPHFATGYMRNWGRDTFIALRGLFLVTGRYDEARYIILAYAGCLRHGLIPNLLDGGHNSRYNCRDATWWWLQCIQDYTKLVPNGITILKDKVSRLYPTDDCAPLDPGVHEQLLEDVIQEAMQKHFQGVAFKERNAGIRLDSEMTEEGFNNCIGVDYNTGFVYGGNVYNCGTWMDKMGSSEVAGNKGRPATPRDGSAVEIVGLSKSAVRWLKELYKQRLFPHPGVERVDDQGQIHRWSWEDWDMKIQQNFEKYFYINADGICEAEPHPELIHRHGIYKDCVNSAQKYSDYQLRCNFPIAMVVAPEMFTPKRAWIALSNADSLLRGPLGMRTLDSADWAYDGFYDNSNNSTDTKVARGFNYHQGPEWLWPLGYFLRALLQFAPQLGGQTEVQRVVVKIKSILSRHFHELETSPWKGLPELTNRDGEHCKFSCPVQAWSMSCLLEVLYELDHLDVVYPTLLLNGDGHH